MILSVDISGVPYPASLNMEVYAEFENQTGKGISEISNKIGDLTLLVYLAIKDGCEQRGVEFNFSVKEFRRVLEPGDMEAITSFIEKSMRRGGSGGPEVEGKKRKARAV